LKNCSNDSASNDTCQFSASFSLRMSCLNVKQSLPFTIIYLFTTNMTIVNDSPPDLHTYAIRTAMVTSTQRTSQLFGSLAATRGTRRWPITSGTVTSRNALGLRENMRAPKLTTTKKYKGFFLTNSKTKTTTTSKEQEGIDRS
jgi:hypothetical protein